MVQAHEKSVTFPRIHMKKKKEFILKGINFENGQYLWGITYMMMTSILEIIAKEKIEL